MCFQREIRKISKLIVENKSVSAGAMSEHTFIALLPTRDEVWINKLLQLNQSNIQIYSVTIFTLNTGYSKYWVYSKYWDTLTPYQTFKI